MLHAAAEVERAGASARSPRGYVRAASDRASGAGTADLRRGGAVRAPPPGLAPRVRETFARLHPEAERAVAESLVARGWEIRAAPAEEARGFWAVVLGIALERGVAGRGVDDATAEATVQLVLNLYARAGGGRRG